MGWDVGGPTVIVVICVIVGLYIGFVKHRLLDGFSTLLPATEHPYSLEKEMKSSERKLSY